MTFFPVTLKSYRDVPTQPDPVELPEPVERAAHTVTLIITRERTEILIAQRSGSRRIVLRAEESVQILPEWLQHVAEAAQMLTEELSPQPR